MCKSPKPPKPKIIMPPAPQQVFIPPPPPPPAVAPPVPYAVTSTVIRPRDSAENTGVRKSAGEKKADEDAKLGTATFENPLNIGTQQPKV